MVNNRKFKEFKPKDIDFVFITHVHGDHSLLNPKLYKEGCRAATIVSNGSNGDDTKDYEFQTCMGVETITNRRFGVWKFEA